MRLDLSSLALSRAKDRRIKAEGRFTQHQSTNDSKMCSIAIVNPFIEAMADALREAVDNIATLRRENILASFADIDKRVPDDEDSKLALAVFMPHIKKYAHVLLDFYEDSGLSPAEFKNLGDDLVNDFKMEPEQRICDEQRPALQAFNNKLKEHLKEMALVISSKTHEDVRADSTAFMTGVDMSELGGFDQALLIKARAFSHLLLVVHESGKKEGRTEEEFQEKCAADITSVLGVNV